MICAVLMSATFLLCLRILEPVDGGESLIDSFCASLVCDVLLVCSVLFVCFSLWLLLAFFLFFFFLFLFLFLFLFELFVLLCGQRLTESHGYSYG